MTLALILWAFNTCGDCLSTLRQHSRSIPRLQGPVSRDSESNWMHSSEEENQSRAINYKDPATGWGHALATDHWKLEQFPGAVPLHACLVLVPFCRHGLEAAVRDRTRG